MTTLTTALLFAAVQWADRVAASSSINQTDDASMTRSEIAIATRRSASWLDRHCCGLCEQAAMKVIKYGCCSLFGKRCTREEIIERVRRTDEALQADESEIWKPVDGFQDYEVSNQGRVRSLTVLRQHGGYRPRVIPGRILKQTNQRYPAVVLYAYGKRHNARVHVLVARAFVPNPQGLPLACHKDDVGNNNVASNLEWGTHTSNSLTKQLNGKAAKRLDAATVRAIKLALKTTTERSRITQIAKQFGTTRTTVVSIAKGKIWRHVTV